MILRAVPATDRKLLSDFVNVFNEWSERFGINTPLRVAHFLAQCWYESGCLKTVEENMNYSAQRLMQVWPSRFKTITFAQQYAHQPEKLANYVYANRMGNGNEDSGDGWRYIGRGLIGTTGRANYYEYAKSGFCVGDLMSHPEWLAKSPGCIKSAMFFWWKNGLNQIADTDNVHAVTRKVNGGLIGLSSRQYYLRRFKSVFGV